MDASALVWPLPPSRENSRSSKGLLIGFERAWDPKWALRWPCHGPVRIPRVQKRLVRGCGRVCMNLFRPHGNPQILSLAPLLQLIEARHDSSSSPPPFFFNKIGGRLLCKSLFYLSRIFISWRWHSISSEITCSFAASWDSSAGLSPSLIVL